MPAAKVLDVSEFLVDRQVRARDFWAAVEVGGQPGTAAVRSRSTSRQRTRRSGRRRRWAATREAILSRARLRRRRDRGAGGVGRGRRRDGGGAVMILEGVRVIEFSIAWAGPLAGRFLGDLGAEVIKVEHPTSRGGHLPDDPSLRERDGIDDWTWGTLPGPIFRSGIFPDAEPGEQPWNRQGVFNKMNRNKRSLGIDLKLPGGREVFDRLVAASDVRPQQLQPARRAQPRHRLRVAGRHQPEHHRRVAVGLRRHRPRPGPRLVGPDARGAVGPGRQHRLSRPRPAEDGGRAARPDGRRRTAPSPCSPRCRSATAPARA